MRKKNKLLYGVGVNDADYYVAKRNNGVQEICPIYSVWGSMLSRCYGDKKYHTYKDCSVCEEWLTFSNFKKWMEKQDWQGKQLDKDIILSGNKLYSPETCAFVNKITNSFIIDCGSSANNMLTGSSYVEHKKKFQSGCCNPFTGKREGLGYFFTADEAHQAWRKRKNEIAHMLADMESDERVSKSLKERYA